MTDYSQMELRRSAQEQPEPREQEIEIGTLWNGYGAGCPSFCLQQGPLVLVFTLCPGGSRMYLRRLPAW